MTQTFSVDSLITALYRSMLQREPEELAVAHWRNQLLNTNDVRALIEDFLHSPEFIAKVFSIANIFPYDRAPYQHIEAQVGDDIANKLWLHIEDTWSRLGNEDPYFSVLTDPRYRKAAISDNSVIEAFYESGRGDWERVERWLERNAVSLNQNAVVLEYGCGVGRFTEWLARRFASVVAMDISSGHLALAAKRAKSQDLNNIRFAKISGRADLSQLRGMDFFYSLIVLQHNPPPIILSVLDAAFSGLNEGGIAYFQTPTYGPNYTFKVAEYMKHLAGHEMEMHALDQKTIFRLARRHGLTPLEVSQDHCTGGHGVSTTFLLQKGLKRTEGPVPVAAASD